MTTDGQLLINSLNTKISQCGKCDCCQELQNQINQIKAQISNNRAFDGKELFEKIKPYLVPAIAPIAIAAVVPQLQPLKLAQEALKLDFAQTKGQVKLGLDLAKDASGKVITASNAAEFASKQSNQALKLSTELGGKLAPVANKADDAFLASSKALQQAGNAAIMANAAKASAGSALSRVGAIAVALSGLAASVGVLKFTEGRFEAVERVTDGLGRDINRVLQTLGIVNDRAITAQNTANSALKQAEKADDKAFSAEQKASAANNTANDAKAKANAAAQTANQSTNKADAAAKTATQASNKAQQANGKADEALNKIAVLAGLFGGLNGKFFELANTLKNEFDAKLKNMPSTDLNPVLNKLSGIDARIAALAGLAVPIGQIQNKVNQLPNAKDVREAAQKGSCDTMNSPQCTVNFENRINKNTDAVGRALNNRLGNLFNGLNLGANSAQLAMLQGIDRKLGAQVPGGIAGALGRLWQTLQVDRVLNMLTYIGVLHNAMMLSNNIGQTLFSAIDNISQSVGFKWKNEKGEDTGFGSVVGEWTTNFFKGLFGAENYNTLTNNFKKANRIYQSGANIINSVRSMMDSVRNISEFIAENTGRIGNALKKYQVIAPDAFKWMPEQVNGQSILVQRLQNLEEAVSGIEMISSEVLNVTQNVNEINQQYQEFQKSISDSPKKEQLENTAIKTDATIQKAVSSSPAIPAINSDADKEPDT